MLVKNQTRQISTKYLKTTIKHSSAELIFWASVQAIGPEKLTFIESFMNSSVNQIILQSDMKSSVLQLKLGHNLVMTQQNNDPKHNSKSTTDQLKKFKNKRTNVLH